MSLVSARRQARSKRWVTSRIAPVLTIVTLLLLWEGLARLIDDNRIVPNIDYTYRSITAERVVVTTKLVETFLSVLVAFVLAVIFGILLGMIIAEIFTVRQMFMPVIIFAYAIPHPILAPVFIIWFLLFGEVTIVEFTGPAAYLFSGVDAAQATQSIGITGVTVFGAWVAFFPVFLNTITGMNQLEERYEHLGTVLGATRWQMIRYFRFYRALPNIASSIKTAVQLSIVGVIVAEFITTGTGIGFEIVLAWKTAELGYMFGVVILIMVSAYAFFQTAVWLTKKLTPPGID